MEDNRKKNTETKTQREREFYPETKFDKKYNNKRVELYRYI